MKKYLLFLSLCPLAVGMAATVRAQTTPEALIGQCPSLPAVSTLAAWATSSDNQAAQQAIDAFLDKINALNEKGNQMAERMMPGIQAAAMSDADRVARQQTGKSIQEIQGMSDRQLEAFANQQAASRLSSAGLGGMSLSQLQSLEGKSEEEILNALSGSVTGMTGLTAKELKAMENMTEKQAEAYLKQGDRMQRMQAAAARQPQIQPSADPRLDQAEELQRITDRWTEIDRLNAQEAEQTVQKIYEIQARYQPRIDAIKPTGVMHDTEIFTESEARARQGLAMAMNSECYTLWCNRISNAQGRIKTKLADVDNYDRINSQLLAAGGGAATAKVMPSIGYSIAGQYLSLASSVTTLPQMR